MKKQPYNRRDFIRTAAVAGMGIGLMNNTPFKHFTLGVPEGHRVGIIGLDTSHSIAFTKSLNTAQSASEYLGYKVVAAYPKGSNDIKTSVDRIPGYIQEVKQYNVEITNSVEELLDKVDVVMLETNDGRLHLEQALMVFKAGKRMFIDKPISASLVDTLLIFEASRKYNIPVFSTSSLRYITGAKEIQEGKIGKIIGSETYSPATIEKTHPDLYWYGIHGVETLFTFMGTGCKSVVNIFSDQTEVIVGKWKDDRIGTFRGIRSGKSNYGGIVFGETGISVLGEYAGYNSLLIEIVKFFQTGISPVKEEETLEIFAFMDAAEKSKLQGGLSVELETVMQRAKKHAFK